MKDRLKVLAISCLGLGLSPVAPGTVGTLGGVGLALLLPSDRFLPSALAALLVVSALSVALGPWAERHFGVKDPPAFVLDEVAGFLITILHPSAPTPARLALGFVLFRVLDVVKPPPARRLESLPAGWGVLLDDAACGVYGLALLSGARAAGASFA
ncbi:MAG TPA: phosphatidylglycerophosphatase A [Planctomycetota bacterium]|nr:phosphatidylglycerophosphatase A [Planctomycetota bacterium]